MRFINRIGWYNCWLFALYILITRREKCSAVYLSFNKSWLPHVMVELNRKYIVHPVFVIGSEDGESYPFYFTGRVKISRGTHPIRHLIRLEP